MADESWDDYVAEAEASGFGEAAPFDTYQVRIESAEAGESSKAKTPLIEVRTKIIDGPHAGKKATTYPATFYKSNKSAAGKAMFMSNMKAFGITGETLVKHKPTLAQIAAVLPGKVVTIKTGPKKNQDGSVNDEIADMIGTFKAPETGAIEVTSFPPVMGGGGGTAAPSGYTSDPGF